MSPTEQRRQDGHQSLRSSLKFCHIRLAYIGIKANRVVLDYALSYFEDKDEHEGNGEEKMVMKSNSGLRIIAKNVTIVIKTLAVNTNILGLVTDMMYGANSNGFLNKKLSSFSFQIHSRRRLNLSKFRGSTPVKGFYSTKTTSNAPFNIG